MLRERSYLIESKGPRFKKTKMKMAIRHGIKKKMKPGEEYVDVMALGPVGYHKGPSGWVVSHVRTGMRINSFNSQKAARLFAQYMAKVLPDTDNVSKILQIGRSSLSTMKGYMFYLQNKGSLPYQEWEQASQPTRDKPLKGFALYGR